MAKDLTDILTRATVVRDESVAEHYNPIPREVAPLLSSTMLQIAK